LTSIKDRSHEGIRLGIEVVSGSPKAAGSATKLDVSAMSHYADFSPEYRFSAVESGPSGSGKQ